MHFVNSCSIDLEYRVYKNVANRILWSYSQSTNCAILFCLDNSQLITTTNHYLWYHFEHFSALVHWYSKRKQRYFVCVLFKRVSTRQFQIKTTSKQSVIRLFDHRIGENYRIRGRTWPKIILFEFIWIS